MQDADRIACMKAIEELTRDEMDGVMLNAHNADFSGPESQIQVTGDWIDDDYDWHSFYGTSWLDCLQQALNERRIAEEKQT